MRALLAGLVLLAAGCAGSQLRTAPVERLPATGDYRLMLVGGNYIEDRMSLALLDREGDGFEIFPYLPEHSYSAFGPPGPGNASEAAIHFVLSLDDASGFIASAIYGPEGREVLGYEIRPLYHPLVHGVRDVLEVQYVLKDKGKVEAHIRLSESVERERFGGDASIPRR